MASKLYDSGAFAIANQALNWGSATVKWMLLKSSYTPNQGTDANLSDISASEIVATGYARVAAAGKAQAIDTTNHRSVFTATSPTFGAIGGAVNDTMRYLVAFLDTGVAGTSTLLAYDDLGLNTPTNGGTFGVTLPAYAAGGAFNLQH